MQGLDIYGSIVYGFPPIIIGLFFGFILGPREKMPHLIRVVLSIIISIGGGYILALYVFDPLITANSNLILLCIMAFEGGVILGMIIRWKPYIHEYVDERIIYELDDDEEFDRQLDDAIHGS